MVRIDFKIPVAYSGSNVSRYHIEGTCSAGDEKPTEKIAGGSFILETDTGVVNFYDENSEQWVKHFSIKDKSMDE